VACLVIAAGIARVLVTGVDTSFGRITQHGQSATSLQGNRRQGG